MVKHDISNRYPTEPDLPPCTSRFSRSMQTFPETSQQAEPFRGCEYRYRPVLSFRVAWNALLWLRHHQNLSLEMVPFEGGRSIKKQRALSRRASLPGRPSLKN